MIVKPLSLASFLLYINCIHGFHIIGSGTGTRAMAPTPTLTTSALIRNINYSNCNSNSNSNSNSNCNNDERNQSSLFASTTMDGNSSIGGGIALPTSVVGNSNQQASSQSDRTDVKVGVLFLNLGGPEKTEDVEGA